MTTQFGVPISVLTDSYKAGHFEQYPESQQMVAYGEFRAPFKDPKSGKRDTEDTRFVFYGIRYIVENYLCKQWTEEAVNNAAKFYSTHNVGHTPYPFPADLFKKFVKENNGYFPVKIEALPEGTVANIHVPVYQITAKGEYSRLVTFLETILTHIWYPTTVATLSRRTKALIGEAFDKTVDDSARFLLNSRLHDFGFRGCSSVEQSILGGTAHLINFEGSDTMSACYYAQFTLNGGKPVATSVPASEHSVMTSFRTEKEAIKKMQTLYGNDNAIFSVVFDSYDYNHALDNLLPALHTYKTERGNSIMVIRPDSGDPTDCVVAALKAGAKTGGFETNSKGYKVVKGYNVIQGDGINYAIVAKILKAVVAEGFSVQCVGFGMGGGLLMKVNRDTMSFATKLCYIRYANGDERKVMKCPKTDSGKISFPGILKVIRNDKGAPVIYPCGADEKVDPEKNLLKVVYDCGPIKGHTWDDFDTIKKRVETEWNACPKAHDPISKELYEQITIWKKKLQEAANNQ